MQKGEPGDRGASARPAPYSTTDAAETEAVTALRSLLDSGRVRADLRERDKYPNIDGYIDLVDVEGRPQAKIEVQIKTLASDAISCRCPSSLVAYSAVTTLPVILVGVDPLNFRAYWTHVSELMPGYISTQQSFTVRFADSVDSIDKTVSCPCYRRWLELGREYQERIRKYPLLDVGINREDPLASLPPQRREALQRYVDTINHLFDHDFKTIKKVLFPNVWKFGVGCRLLDQGYVLYQISRIPMGKPAPLVVGLPEHVTLTAFGRDVQTAAMHRETEFFATPELNGQEFVFRFVKNFCKAKAFSVHGVEMAADVIIAFLKRYHRWLEIEPENDEYRVEDLRRAFGPTLSRTAESVANRLPTGPSGVKIVDLDLMVNRLRDVPTDGANENRATTTYVLSSKPFPGKLAFESLSLLCSRNVPVIIRRFRTGDLEHQPPPRNLIWSCYSRHRETDNVTEILKRVIGEYEIFVRGNTFRLEGSPYLDPTTSIVFEYVSFYDNPAGWEPLLREYHLRDPHHASTKTSVLVAGDSGQFCGAQPGSSIVINNSRLEIVRVRTMCADFLFGEAPLSNLIYRFLADDLSLQYKEVN